MKINIAYVSSGFFETDLNVIKNLTEFYNVEWFVVNNGKRFNDEYFKKFVRNSEVNLHLFSYKRKRSLNVFLIYFKIVISILKKKCKIVFSANYEPYWWFWVSLFIKRNRLIQGVHDVKPHSDWNEPFFLKLGRSYMFKWPRYFVLYSKNQKDLFDNIVGKDNHVVYLSTYDYGIPTSEKLIIEKGVKFLFWGAIQYYKGLDLLIDATERLKSEGYKNFEVTICGHFRTANSSEKEYPDLCISKIKTGSLFNLRFEFIPHDEIPNMLNSHHFFIMPYRDATQSGPLMTAINYSLPVIAPNYGIFKDTLNHNQNSILYTKSEDITGLVQAMTKVLNMNSVSYNSIVEQAEKLKYFYSKERVALNYKTYFDQIISVVS